MTKSTQGGIATIALLIGLGLAFAAIVSGAWFAIRSIEARGHEKGVAEQKVETDKVAAELENVRTALAAMRSAKLLADASIARLEAALGQANARVDALKDAENAAQARARAALARLAAVSRQHQDEVARLRGIIDGPPLTGDTAAEAHAILKRLAVQRTGG